MGNTWKWINLTKTDKEIRQAIIDWGNPKTTRFFPIWGIANISDKTPFKQI